MARDGHSSQEEEHIDMAQLLHDAGLHAELVKQLARQLLVYQLLHGNTAQGTVELTPELSHMMVNVLQRSDSFQRKCCRYGTCASSVCLLQHCAIEIQAFMTEILHCLITKHCRCKFADRVD